MTNLPEQLRAAAKAIEDLQKRHNPEWMITPFNLRFWADEIEKEDHSIETLARQLHEVMYSTSWSTAGREHHKLYRERAGTLAKQGWSNPAKKPRP